MHDVEDAFRVVLADSRALPQPFAGLGGLWGAEDVPCHEVAVPAP